MAIDMTLIWAHPPHTLVMCDITITSCLCSKRGQISLCLLEERIITKKEDRRYIQIMNLQRVECTASDKLNISELAH